MKNNFNDEYLNLQDINVSLDIELVKKNIPIFTSQKLCDMIICERYFNMNKEIAIFCMEELSKRRQDGDQFNFEQYIETSFQELPKLNFDMPDLRTILNQVKKKI